MAFCHPGEQVCKAFSEAETIGDMSIAISFAECYSTCGQGNVPPPPCGGTASAHAEASVNGAGGAHADASATAGTNCDPSTNPAGYDSCYIHVNCMNEDNLWPMWTGDKWVCSDDPNGQQSNNGWDNCHIHAGCSQPAVWPQYDTDQQTWLCCDEMAEGCLQSQKPPSRVSS